MGELIDLAEYRNAKTQKEIEAMRTELKHMTAQWIMVGFIFASPIPPIGFSVTQPDPVGIPVQIS